MIKVVDSETRFAVIRYGGLVHIFHGKDYGRSLRTICGRKLGAYSKFLKLREFSNDNPDEYVCKACLRWCNASWIEVIEG